MEKWRNRISFLVVVLLAVTFTATVVAETSESYAAVYQVYPSGGTVAWFDAPVATNYRCTLIIKDLSTGGAYWVTTSNYTLPNAEDILFQFNFDFSGKNWEIVGDPNLVYTSGCEAWTSTWGIHELFTESVFVDFRSKVHLPLTIK